MNNKYFIAAFLCFYTGNVFSENQAETIELFQKLAGGVKITQEELDDYIKDGGDINAKTSSGHTILMYLAWMGFDNQNLVKAAIRKGANVNDRQHGGWTALKYAANGRDDQDKREIFKILLEGGANPYLADRDGKTVIADVNDKPAMKKILDGFLKLQTPEHKKALQAVAQKALTGIFPRSAEGMAKQLAPEVQKFLRPDLQK